MISIGKLELVDLAHRAYKLCIRYEMEDSTIGGLLFELGMTADALGALADREARDRPDDELVNMDDSANPLFFTDEDFSVQTEVMKKQLSNVVDSFKEGEFVDVAE